MSRRICQSSASNSAETAWQFEIVIRLIMMGNKVMQRAFILTLPEMKKWKTVSKNYMGDREITPGCGLR
ncbi:MAG: hypothetical protein N0E54_12015 [Candidatus Thiodiazotropha taylori]|nr:hypothetical protein [Candidatus Thiodiazotropha endolucinida]MCW4229457.1 hypothetical protein [Candidatus Thiodiazotropha taylori]